MHPRVAGSPRLAAVLAGTLLGGATALDPPLSWLGCGFVLIGAAVVRSSRPVAGGTVADGVVVGHVVQPLPRSRRRGPVRSERIRYRARGIDGVWREHEVVHALASSRPSPLGTTRTLSYHPAAPADGRILDRRVGFVGWWFVVLGVWSLVLFGLGRSLVGLGWTLGSIAATLWFTVAAPVAPPPVPVQVTGWRPPPPSWPQAGDASARGRLVPGVARHLRRDIVLAVVASFAVAIAALTVLGAL